MVFSSLTFLFLFFPALFFAYFVLARTRGQKNAVLLLFSICFYGWGGVKLLALIFLSIFMNHAFGLLVAPGRKRRKMWAWMAAAANLALLFCFKYLGFTTQILSSLFAAVPALKIVLPIGISFYTFQGMSYVLDVYHDDVPPEKSLANTALYITLFPQLVAGPIVRYKTVAHEIRCRHESVENVAEGMVRFSYGLAKKVLIANQVGLLADSAFNQSAAFLSCGTAWLGILGYALQIYFDFSGYSDMAIGIGRMFGFHFLENFNYPYISRSITEFWRRWHISLGSWFRDYVYVPLGGNRVSRGRHIRNIFVVWALTGFWHGANWTFLFWGLYYALFLLGEKFLWGGALKKLPAWVQHLYAMVGILVGWVIFRATEMAQIGTLTAAMFGFAQNGFWDGQATFLLLQYRWDLLLAGVLSCPVVPAVRAWMSRQGKAGETALTLLRPLLSLGLLALSLVRLVSSGFNPFIYFQF